MKEIIKGTPFCKIDGHIHTHLCDGKPEMTVESIAKKAAGGVEKVISELYKTEINAIKKATHPVSLGHFFAAHSYAVKGYSWFNMQPHHINLMKEGASELADVCKQAGAMIDLTGIHPKDMSYAQKIVTDGFFYDFQRWFISLCRQKDIVIYPGSDAHSLRSVGKVSYYNNLI